MPIDPSHTGPLLVGADQIGESVAVEVAVRKPFAVFMELGVDLPGSKIVPSEVVRRVSHAEDVE